MIRFLCILSMILFVGLSLAFCGRQTDNIRVVTAAGGLRMRTMPDPNSPVLVIIPDGASVENIQESGDTVTISGKTGKWTQVRFQNQAGWVFGGFLARRAEKEASEPLSGEWCFYDKPGPHVNPGPYAMWVHKVNFRPDGTCSIRFNQGEGFENYECSFTSTQNRINIAGTTSAPGGIALDRKSNSLEFAEKTAEFDFYFRSNLIGSRCTP